ncbi:unnamed protein product [Angiostrongylus costaricensis]|uniref:CW domain-containing protein n=1 Tax=Angiostrongylus costaricensis TaxID=334426 RepID=A0A0R3PLI7_ANGCS|nr:unnamed protein product [Angiostrongylus costaricensis]
MQECDAMQMMSSRISLLLAVITNFSDSNSNVEIVPTDCDCRDWYGTCRRRGEKWTDDETWNYECDGTNGTDARFVACVAEPPVKEIVPVGANVSIGELWHSCDANTQRLKYESDLVDVLSFFTRNLNEVNFEMKSERNLEPHCLVNGHVKKVHSEFRDGRFQWLCLETGRWVIGCYYSNETHPDVFLKIGEFGHNGLIKHVCDRYGDYPGRVQYYAEVRGILVSGPG